ncbi:MAG: hypothetical protein DMD84_19875 [Candidatus Rokuibacteriota bacterium]|nr:MAG: hypothetical protein DMD84_19875 [Candidatus Rokubacteria bacterium]
MRGGVGNQRALPAERQRNLQRRDDLDRHGHRRRRPHQPLQQHERIGRAGRLHLARRRGPGRDVHRHQPERREPQRRRGGLGPRERAIVHATRGFTLAEVLVATALLTIGLVAIATGFQYAASGVATGGGETAAVFLAEQRIEQLRAQAMTDFSAAALDAGTTTEYCLSGTIWGGSSNCDGAPVVGPSYRRTTTITDLGGGTGCPATPLWCKEIQVRVSYRPVTGAGDLSQPRAVDVFTVLGPRT